MCVNLEADISSAAVLLFPGIYIKPKLLHNKRFKLFRSNSQLPYNDVIIIPHYSKSINL